MVELQPCFYFDCDLCQRRNIVFGIETELTEEESVLIAAELDIDVNNARFSSIPGKAVCSGCGKPVVLVMDEQDKPNYILRDVFDEDDTDDEEDDD